MSHARPHPPPIYTERPDCWHVYYGDVHLGTIAKRSGIPFDQDPWGWAFGFIPAAMRENTRTG
jgi:hypothetical protein